MSKLDSVLKELNAEEQVLLLGVILGEVRSWAEDIGGMRNYVDEIAGDDALKDARNRDEGNLRYAAKTLRQILEKEIVRREAAAAVA